MCQFAGPRDDATSTTPCSARRARRAVVVPSRRFWRLRRTWRFPSSGSHPAAGEVTIAPDLRIEPGYQARGRAVRAELRNSAHWRGCARVVRSSYVEAAAAVNERRPAGEGLPRLGGEVNFARGKRRRTEASTYRLYTLHICSRRVAAREARRVAGGCVGDGPDPLPSFARVHP